MAKSKFPYRALMIAIVAIVLSLFFQVDDDDADDFEESTSFGTTSRKGVETKPLSLLTEEGVIGAWLEGSVDPRNNIGLVDRIPFEEMTHLRFRNDYQSQRKPVILTGAYADNPLMNDNEWGWQALHDKYGHVELETRVPRHLSKRGCTGTGLCLGQNITLQELMQTYFIKSTSSSENKPPPQDSPYPHDLSLLDTLPDMYQHYRKHAYFSENLLLPGQNGHDRWPSVFFGAQHTQTGLHVDSMGTSFTMAVFRGRKQFVLLDSTQGPLLCLDRPLKHLDYGLDALRPDFEYCPTAKKAHVLFANVTASDILYMPGSYHHAAWNVQDSLGISQNYLSVDDYHSAMESFVGYTKHIQQLRKKQKAHISVPLDFLAMRDLFRLLASSEYRSNWRDGPQWWRADEATRESFTRVRGHLVDVLERDPLQAWRPAFFGNTNLARLALKNGDAWECLSERTRLLLSDDSPGNPVKGGDMLQMLGQEFEHHAYCASTRKKEWDLLMEAIQKAVPTLDQEGGLTRHLWSHTTTSTTNRPIL